MVIPLYSFIHINEMFLQDHVQNITVHKTTTKDSITTLHYYSITGCSDKPCSYKYFTEVLKINETHHPLQDLSKDDMFPIEPWRLHGGNEELGSISVFACIGHAQPSWSIVLQLEVLIREAITIDALSYRSSRTEPAYTLVMGSSCNLTLNPLTP